MYPVAQLLDEQESFDHEFNPFLTDLEPKATITLCELLTDRHKAATILPWVNTELLRERLDAACKFLGQLGSHPRLRKHRTLYFFQNNDPEADLRKTRESMIQSYMFLELYVGRWGPHTHPQVRYLQTDSNFTYSLQGENGHKRIRTLLSFASRDRSEELPRRGVKTLVPCNNVIGYQLCHYPEVLGVSSDIATEYLVRIVIHDIGHAWLPETPNHVESLHNAVMLHATGALGRTACSSEWERVVLAECTDPYFFATGYLPLRACDATHLTPEQQYVLRTYCNWYDSSQHITNLRHVWGISAGMQACEAQHQAELMLKRVWADGFGRYDLPPLARSRD